MNAKREHSATADDGPREYWGAPAHEWCSAAGLAILIYWRPWQDGIVVADSNGAYLLGIILLFGLWAARSLIRGTANFAVAPSVLLFGFLAAAWLTGFSSVQYYSTQVALTIWCGHAMVFVLASSLRSGSAIGFVIAFVVVTSGAESFFSIIHLKYSLPETRLYVQGNPAAAAQLFGHELNAALVHRLNSNRAFGTLLFANALATWLVATIPLSLFGAWHAIRKFLLGGEASKSAAPTVRGVVVGIVAASISIPILSAAQTITAPANVAFSDVVVGVPFSTVLMRVPVAAIVVVCVQLVAIGIAFGVYAVLSMLLKPGNGRGEESTAHAMIAGVLTAGVLCLSIAVLYSRFHFFYFAEQMSIDGKTQFARAPVWRPLIPFLLCVFVVPVTGAGIAIRVTRQRGPVACAWLALGVVFSAAALFQCAALWMTYSRGGMLALAVGVIVTLLLFRPNRPAPNTIARLVSAGAGFIFVVATAALTLGGDAFAQDGNQDVPVNPFVADIKIEGADMTFGDLANPATVALRFSYWSGAFKMAADDFLTGVGLGNFGVAYPQYQPLGGGDTKQAHNDFLQILCETGFAGFLFFTGFWTWFVIVGGRVVRAATSKDGGWWLAGLYACVLGFLIHAVVDFPFVDPSLAMLVFLLAGLFWAKARGQESTPNNSPVRARVLMSICLLIAVAVSGVSARVGHVNASVGTNQVRQERVRVASQFLRGIETPPNAPPSVPDRAVALLIEDPATRAAFGTYLFHPRPGDPSYAQLPPGSPIPRDAVLMLTNLPLATSKAKEASAGWTTRIAEADAVFPYDPDIAFHISLWFDMLWRSGENPTDGLVFTKQAVTWAERAVERNPRQVAYHDWLFKMRWRQALSEPEIEDQLAYYELSLEAIDRTVELYPIKPHLWDRHALMYLYAFNKFTERGQLERAEECAVIMKQSQDEALSLREQLASMQQEES